MPRPGVVAGLDFDAVHARQQFLSQALSGHDIALEEVQDGIWNILFYDTLLGRLDELNETITGAPSPPRKVLTMYPDTFVTYVSGPYLPAL
ncbi:MAG: hypothetical protein ACRD1X_20340 [Vicinamibacteria bacterium]